MTVGLHTILILRESIFILKFDVINTNNDVISLAYFSFSDQTKAT
ncbi:MAG: hypothetical protein ACTS7E_04625 [Arsenophonus sp. NC-CH8-MAG3]